MIKVRTPILRAGCKSPPAVNQSISGSPRTLFCDKTQEALIW